jgi:hypothetical protein
VDGVADGLRKAAQRAACSEAADEDAGVFRVKGEVGSTQRTPTVFSFFRKEAIRASTRVLFPAPGEPVIPTTWARPVWGKIRMIAVFASGRSSSRFRIRREAVRTSPARILRSCSISSRFCVMRLPCRSNRGSIPLLFQELDHWGKR